LSPKSPPKSPPTQPPETPPEGKPVEGKPIKLGFPSNILLAELCGQHDIHLQQIEERLGVQLVVRGNQMAIMGPADQAQKARVVLEDLYDLLEKGMPITNQQVDAALRVSDGLLKTRLRPAELMGQDALINTPLKKIAPRTLTQHAYVAALRSSELVFGVGPAGTGKTYMAVAYAVQLFIRREVQKIILTRPVLEAGERLGFLPGTFEEKIDPYLRPLYDALDDTLGRERTAHLKEQGAIEIAPLAYMRGRTLTECVMILDEAQNTTVSQMKMFLTRMGEGSRMIITGDPTQTDLKFNEKSGLKDALEVLEGLPTIEVVKFTESDVVRHRMVARVVQAYNERDRQLSFENNK
jgi:phosphate starvation-inducible PhoH-like protein